MSDVALLSVRSPHVERILDGSKTVELRRRAIRITAGTIVLLYAAGARKELVGSFVAGDVTSGVPSRMWRQYGAAAGLTKREYDSYFAGAPIAYVLPVGAVSVLESPIPLDDLRQRWREFSAPQTHRWIRATELRHLLNGERRHLIAAT